MSNATIHVAGLEQIKLKMEAISAPAAVDLYKAALRKAANVIADKARANARALDDEETRNSIEKNIAVAFSKKTFTATGNLMMRVGVMGTAKSYVNSSENRRKKRVGGTYVAGGDIAAEGGGPGGPTFYWRFLEFGTSKMGKRPLMRNAMNEGADSALNTFAQQADKAIDKAIAKGGAK